MVRARLSSNQLSELQFGLVKGQVPSLEFFVKTMLRIFSVLILPCRSPLFVPEMNRKGAFGEFHIGFGLQHFTPLRITEWAKYLRGLFVSFK